MTIDLKDQVGDNPAVSSRRQLAAALFLLTAAAVPQLLWLGVHALVSHQHAKDEVREAEWSNLVKSLIHGHEHAAGVPDHEHHLLPSPPLRLNASRPSEELATAVSAAPEVDLHLLSSVHKREDRINLTGSGPPRLHFLCVLLI